MKKTLFTAAVATTALYTLLPGASAAGSYDQQARSAAEYLYCSSLLEGSGTLPDGTPDFDLQKTTTRGEAVIMVLRLSGQEAQAKQAAGTHPFTDVASWADSYVSYAYAHGISQGVSGSSFGFSQAVTQEEYLTMLLRAMGYTEVDWQNPYPVAAQLGLIEGDDYYRNTTFRRGEMCILSNSILDAAKKGAERTLYQYLDQNGLLTWRYLPQPEQSGLPGPRMTVRNQITVNEPDELGEKLSAMVMAHHSQVVVYTPLWEEQACAKTLQSSQTRLQNAEVDYIDVTWYPGQGYLVADISYQDQARVMAYAAGVSDTLSEEDQRLYQQAMQLHDELVDNSMTAYQQVVAFHDYLCQNVTYQPGDWKLKTASHALMDHTANSQGYASAMDLLCFFSGIDCRSITGQAKGEDHTWSKVQVEGMWYNVDTALDDRPNSVSYDYFLCSDSVMVRDHVWERYAHWPSSQQEYKS